MKFKNAEEKKLMVRAISEQLNSPETPYVKKTYDRLIAHGYKKEAVMTMLASVLAIEVWEMKTENRMFDEPIYLERLNALPDMGWLDVK